MNFQMEVSWLCAFSSNGGDIRRCFLTVCYVVWALKREGEGGLYHNRFVWIDGSTGRLHWYVNAWIHSIIHYLHLESNLGLK